MQFSISSLFIQSKYAAKRNSIKTYLFTKQNIMTSPVQRARYEITQKSTEYALVTRMKLGPDVDITATSNEGMGRIADFIKKQKLERFVRQDEGNKILSYPEDPFGNQEVEKAIFVEPGLLLKQGTDISELRDLLENDEINPAPSSSSGKNVEETKRGRPFALLEAGAGEWAVYHLTGPYSQLKEMWINYIFPTIEKEGKKPEWDRAGCREHYLNSSATNKEDDLMTDVYVPIMPSSKP